MINVGSKLESNARDYNPNNFEICDYCINQPGIFNPEKCHLRCCRRQCKKHPIYHNPKRCFHKCKKCPCPLTYENIDEADEANETAGPSTTTNPIPQRSHGMFQYIEIVSFL